jgi:hypothetical protein
MMGSRDAPCVVAMMAARMALASWETMLRRGLLMAQGACSVAEYWRMLDEKAVAMQLSTAALMAGRGQAAVLAPFAVRAQANARRLRRSGYRHGRQDRSIALGSGLN